MTSHTGTSTTPFLYNGRYGVMTDSNGLEYMRARYYSPELMRFVNADTYKGTIMSSPTLNNYAYANGNPISLIDPFGRCADSTDEEFWPGFLDYMFGPEALDELVQALMVGVFGFSASSVMEDAILAGDMLVTEEMFVGKTNTKLMLAEGQAGRIIRNKLNNVEFAQSQDIIELRGGEIVGQVKNSTPGIDGTLNSIPISLKQYTGSKPIGVLKAASKAQSQALNAGYSGVELYIDAKGVSSSQLVDFAKNGGLSQIPSQGTISAIYVNTADGWLIISDGIIPGPGL